MQLKKIMLAFFAVLALTAADCGGTTPADGGAADAGAGDGGAAGDAG